MCTYTIVHSCTQLHSHILNICTRGGNQFKLENPVIHAHVEVPKALRNVMQQHTVIICCVYNGSQRKQAAH